MLETTGSILWPGGYYRPGDGSLLSFGNPMTEKGDVYEEDIIGYGIAIVDDEFAVGQAARGGGK